MRTMKKWFGALAMVALCATTSLLFTACGDDGGSGSSNGGGNGGSPTDYNSQLVGYWTGKGTNLDGESLSITVRFDSDRNGRIIMSTSKSFVGADIKGWYATENEIRVPSDKFSYALAWRILSGSIVSGKMTIETQGHDGQYWGTVNLQKDNDGGGSSDVSSTPTAVSCYIVKYNNSTGKYSTSRSTYYKALSASGNVALYYSASGSMIGYASSNSDSSMGGYPVSSYSYVLRQVSTSSRTYIYFN